MAGVADDGRMLFDLWGTTVTVTHAIARSAEPGQLLVSDELKDLVSSLDDRAVAVARSDDISLWSIEPERVEYEQPGSSYSTSSQAGGRS
jgi:class 3 adenylate cyclase